MVERILSILKQKNLTPSQFADEIGIQRSGMSHILSGRNNPSLEFVMKILRRYPDIKAEWLLAGSNEQEDVVKETQVHSTVRENTLFDLAEISQKEPYMEKQSPGPAKETGDEPGIEKIVVFYKNKSFRIYHPEAGRD